MSVIRARSKVTVPTVFRADIQGLRAIAVLAVVAFHAALPVPGGFVGVDIFFVISGFVITVMLEREWRETGKVSFGRFYLRRFKRLTPALAMMIAITMILSAVIVSPLGLQQTTAKTAVGGIFLMANLVIAKTVGGYFDAVAGTNPLLHTWSLSVEEQFYLVFPALLVLGWIIARSRRRWAPHVIVAGLGASSLAVMLAPTAGLRLPGSESLWGFYSPLTRAWEFAAGALLALVLTHRSLTGTTATLTGTVGLGLVAASLTLIGEDTTFPGVWTALPVAGTLLLLAGGSDPAAPLSRLLSRGAMVGIGDWSYSIYLWHWPLIVFAGFLWGRNTVALTAAAALALVPALVSYTRLEQPLRNLGRLTRRRWQVVIALTVVPPVLLAGALWAGEQHGWWSNPVRRLQAAAMPFHVGVVNGCDARWPLGSAHLDRCHWNQNAAGKPIYLLGDSNAVQFSEGFVRASRELDRPLFIAATNGCPMVKVEFWNRTLSQKYNEKCGLFVNGTMDALKRVTPGLVVVANSDRYWEESEFAAGTSKANMSNHPEQKVRVLADGLTRTIHEIKRSGHDVLVIQTAPRWGSPYDPYRAVWDPNRCTLSMIVSRRCAAQLPLDDMPSENSAARTAVAAVATATKTRLWDVADLVCPERICSTDGPEFIRYRDTSHISVAQSNALAPNIARVIDDAALGAGPRW